MSARIPNRVVASAVAWSLLAAAPALAQNREHQQMAAELRMLQAQTAQLGLALAALSADLAATNDRVAESERVQQRRFADLELLVKTLTDEVRTIRERTQDTDTRLRTLSDEIDALRMTIVSLPALITQAITQALTPPAPVDPDAPGAEAPAVSGTPPVTPGLPTVPPAIVVPLPETAGLSPNRLYDTAFADYSSGQYEAAITQFRQLVQVFGTAERADDAQYLIGESLVYQGRFEEAIDAYNRVIQNYPTGDQVDMAYFKRGSAQQRLGSVEAARATWEEVIKTLPDSTGARMAAQRLIGLPPP